MKFMFDRSLLYIIRTKLRVAQPGNTPRKFFLSFTMGREIGRCPILSTKNLIYGEQISLLRCMRSLGDVGPGGGEISPFELNVPNEFLPGLLKAITGIVHSHIGTHDLPIADNA